MLSIDDGAAPRLPLPLPLLLLLLLALFELLVLCLSSAGPRLACCSLRPSLLLRLFRLRLFR